MRVPAGRDAPESHVKERNPELVQKVLSIPPALRDVAGGDVDGTLGGVNGWIETAGFGEVVATLLLGASDVGVAPLICDLYGSDTASGNGAAIAGATFGAGAFVSPGQVHCVISVPGGTGRLPRYVRPRMRPGGAGEYNAAVLIELCAPQKQPVANGPPAVLV
jgi:hypothetical protein